MGEQGEAQAGLPIDSMKMELQADGTWLSKLNWPMQGRVIMLKHVPPRTRSRPALCIQWHKILRFSESYRGMPSNFHFFPTSPSRCSICPLYKLQGFMLENITSCVHALVWKEPCSQSEDDGLKPLPLIILHMRKPASKSVSLGLLFSFCALWLKWDFLAPVRKVLGCVIFKALQYTIFFKEGPTNHKQALNYWHMWRQILWSFIPQ